MSYFGANVFDPTSVQEVKTYLENIERAVELWELSLAKSGFLQKKSCLAYM